MAQVQVRDINGAGIPLLNIRYSMKGNNADEAFFDVFTDFAGNSGWPIPGNSGDPSLYTFWINTHNINGKYVSGEYNPADFIVDQNPVDGDFNIRIPIAFSAPSRLHVGSHYFFNERNERVFLKGVTDFLLYKRYLDGENIRPILQQRSELGANACRIIGMVSSFSHWFPQEYGNRYYEGIIPFHRLLAEYGLYTYWTVFADTQIVMPNKQDQIIHFDRVVAYLKECPNSTGELVNEPYAHDNATDDPFAFQRPTVVPFSAGSYNDKYGSQMPPPPRWDFHDFHTPRISEPNREGKNVGDQCMSTNPNYLNGMAVLSGEPDKFGRPDPNGKPRHTDPRLAMAMAGTARGTACGIFYHTNAGIMSVPFSDDFGWNEIACAKAWFRELA